MLTMNNCILKDHTFKNTQVQLTLAMIRAMKLHSKKISNCPRPKKGSMNHFLKFWILVGLKANGCDLIKSYPEIYK
jgi:hypothetical protein